VERDGVAGGEVAEPMRLRREARADDPEALEALVQQQVPPHEKGLDDGLAEIGELVHRPAQLTGAELHDPAVGGGLRGHQRAPAREHVHVAGELAGLVHRDLAGRAARVLDDLDRPLDHDEEAEIAVAFGEQDLAGADGAGMPAGGERGEVLAAQDRKGDFVIVGHRARLPMRLNADLVVVGRPAGPPPG
jgi:hypothetical protein